MLKHETVTTSSIGHVEYGHLDPTFPPSLLSDILGRVIGFFKRCFHMFTMFDL